MGRRIAVIGGGVAGLVATKSCLDEGLEPTCFERRDALGGLWVFDEKVTDSLSCCMWSTMMNTSKEMTCFSDFPMPKEFPNFLHNNLGLDYLRRYAENFKFHDYTRLNTDVVMVKRAEDFFTSGRWTVTSQNVKNGESCTETFDGVLVCSGHHGQKNIPRFPGLGEFKGQILHSHDYRKPMDFTGKRVLVVGLGNSGGDIASEIAVTTEVLMSTRRGAWVLTRRGKRGLPWDMEMYTRFSHLVGKLLPDSVSQALFAADFSAKLDHDLYGLTCPFLPKGLAGFLSDDMANRILCGRIRITDDIKRFAESSVEFVDGVVENIDVVVFATGYHFRFPFIEKEVVDVRDNLMPLYKRVFLPDLDQQTMAFVGFFNVNGGLWPIIELQSRLGARVLSGALRLPSRREMKEDIREMENRRAQYSPGTLRHTLEVDYLPYCDELSELIGCKPNPLRLLLTDPKLGFRVLFGPAVPAQYRLQGPGQWAGARQAILTVMERVRYPFRSRKIPPGLHRSVDLLRKMLYPPKLVVFLLYLAVLVLLALLVLL